MPTMTDPRLAAKLPPTSPQPAGKQETTTAHLPIILLNGSQNGSDTAQVAALVVKTPTTGAHPSLTSALQAAMGANAGTTGATSRLVVIPGARKRKKTGKATVVRRLNPRLRQGVILVTLLIMWTLLAVVSNFLEDFSMGPRVQAANYFSVIIMTVAYLALVALLDPIATLYPNPYDFLLIGNSPVLACIIAGLVVGSALSLKFGQDDKIRIGAAVGAIICEGLIVIFTLMWILNQE